MSPVVVGIAGGTGSGKSTLAARLAAALAPDALHVMHDRYYRNVDDPTTFDYDVPDALHNDELVEHLRLLKAGGPAPLPVYDFRSHTRLEARHWVPPAPVVLLEGILILAVPAIRALIDLPVFVDVADDLRFQRRLDRDVASRGRTETFVTHQWTERVHPAHCRLVAPSQRWATLVVSGTGPLEASTHAVLQALHEVRSRRA